MGTILVSMSRAMITILLIKPVRHPVILQKHLSFILLNPRTAAPLETSPNHPSVEVKIMRATF